MPRTTHEKLVRDNVVSTLEDRGIRCEARNLTPEERLPRLFEKLREEVEECCTAENSPDLAEEIADVLEVLDSLMSEFGIPEVYMRAIKIQKRTLKGGFERGVFLIATEELGGE